METVVWVMILLVCFNFVLKQTYRKAWMVAAISVVCALFVALTWQWAIEQSKSQLNDWLNNPALMLDTAVILSIEVIIQMAYCIMAVHLMNTGKVRRRTILVYRLLRWFPGLLIFPVLFHLETRCMFWLTGMAFTTIAYGLAIVVLLAIPALAWAIKWLIPEKELRLEVFFLSNALIAILGIIATVNGRTAVAGISEVNWGALGGMLSLMLLGGIAGFTIFRLKHNK
ncbi:hypothetical protein [Xylanibacter ruminicola]|uniref:Uncharacterized protein n=1 Tax=Xylanibacter ruminicola TaxID=839 RepID=A0A1M6XYR2_XYLRU|nr:hypothetical protein [Xylanibacter ruminicola]SHL11141.1 hypothetical protein SAMN05216463_12310 [Xylanibacter ruminicola]